MEAYILFGHDNESYAFRERPCLTERQSIHQSVVPDFSGHALTGVRRCKICGELLEKWEESLDGLVLEKKKYDVSCTYDGIDVVSESFRAIYKKAALVGLDFRALPKSPGFFVIQATRTVEFDAERRGTQFDNQCNECRRYESVVGATPTYLKPGSIIGESEFVRTDLEFGSDDEKHPLILCGGTAASILRQSSLRGIELERVEE